MNALNPIPLAADHVKAYSGLIRLAVRLFAREVDPLLYRQMYNADGHLPRQQAPLADPRLAEVDERDALLELAVEFCRLFIGPEPDCPPYASAHHGEAKLGGRAARDIDAFMGEHGLRPVIHEHDAVLDHDHLSVELALLAHLYGVAAGSVTGGLTPTQAWEAAHQLLHAHLWPWADSYLRGLEATARLAPYTTIAHLVRRVLKEATDWPVETLPASDKDNLMVTVYSTPSCGYCARLKSQLSRESIPFTEIDIEQDPSAAEYVMSVNNGNQVVPTVVFADGTAMTNPSVVQVKRQLAGTA